MFGREDDDGKCPVHTRTKVAGPFLTVGVVRYATSTVREVP